MAMTENQRNALIRANRNVERIKKFQTERLRLTEEISKLQAKLASVNQNILRFENEITQELDVVRPPQAGGRP
jgi:uncharacterized protein YlxW (UPF0749 family)